jgi:hypothetical protein
VHPDDARRIFSAWPASDLDRVIVRAVADEASATREAVSHYSHHCFHTW